MQTLIRICCTSIISLSIRKRSRTGKKERGDTEEKRQQSEEEGRSHKEKRGKPKEERAGTQEKFYLSPVFGCV